MAMYSRVPNKRVGWNKRVGGKILEKVINVYSCVSNKRAGWKVCKKLITKQALISEQGGILIIFSKTSRPFKQDID